MAVNKVIYGGNTLVDLTGDTVTAADLADGVKATGGRRQPYCRPDAKGYH